MTRLAWGVAVVMLWAACGEIPNYVIQAGVGQARLGQRAVSIEDAIADPRTLRYQRRLLRLIPEIRRHARQQGLRTKKNYQSFVQLPGPQVVWFVSASKSLSFTPVTWSFPIVGSFPGLGYFHYSDALEMRRKLATKGYDVAIRPVGAFSTGGWFADPILSTMLSPRADAIGQFINVILHESVHATILIDDQGYFNESVASFIADRMTTEYLEAHQDKFPKTRLSYSGSDKRYNHWRQEMTNAYQALEKIYDSDAPVAEKLRMKKEITEGLEKRLSLPRKPNNATLMTFRTYNVGATGFQKLYEHCGQNWPAFIHAVNGLTTKDFGKEQQEDIAPAVLALTKRPCS